jgi:hypothetical protein
MSAANAIVTLAVGARHKRLWQARCLRNWSRYAERHGYDLICIDEPLDVSERARRRSPAWQKCLILDQGFAARYERVVWIDADVLINPAAPSIVEDLPVEQVGAVDEYATPTPELHAENLTKLYRHWEATGTGFIRNETARDYYATYGLAGGFDAVVQTGVMVLSPRHHRDLLMDTYHRYEDKGPGWNLEMRPLSYELLQADCVTWLDPRFNYMWSAYKALKFPFLLNNPAHPRAGAVATAALQEAYFLHFTGSTQDLLLADDEPPARPPSTDRMRRRKAVAPSHWRCSTPVVLFIYARADTARQVLDAVRRVRPARLLVVADGASDADRAPDADGATDVTHAVGAARALIEEVDWECELLSDFSPRHQGLKRRVESGLDWAFGEVQEAIVLEDDCVPDPTFFRFCEELLARHRNDDRVMAISGNNFSSDLAARADRYRYSRYPLIWGWATWRRAWRCYDPAMSRWPELRDSGWLEELLGDRHAAGYWSHLFERTYTEGGSWDYAWVLACWLHGGLSVVPDVNLVTNIGFRADATHTRSAESAFANLPTAEARFPLRHPATVVRDADGDRFLEDVLFSGNLVRMFERLRQARRLARMPAAP